VVKHNMLCKNWFRTWEEAVDKLGEKCHALRLKARRGAACGGLVHL
jgi:hypothetical protein